MLFITKRVYESYLKHKTQDFDHLKHKSTRPKEQRLNLTDLGG